MIYSNIVTVIVGFRREASAAEGLLRFLQRAGNRQSWRSGLGSAADAAAARS